jgi:hypothetical protein
MGPMQPWDWISLVQILSNLGFEVQVGTTYCMPEMNITSANSRALDIQQHLADLQIATLLYRLQAWLCFSDPKIVLWVRVDTNVRLGRLDLCRCRSAHLDGRRVVAIVWYLEK